MTIAFSIAGRFRTVEVVPYIIAQVAGALCASGMLRMLFPTSKTLGATLPRGSEWQSFVLELILTFFLMVVILRVSTGAKEKGITAGIVVGGVIALEAMFAGPICGASMNPVRSIAPALVSGHLEHLWLYVVATIIGAALAVPACSFLRAPECESA